MRDKAVPDYPLPYRGAIWTDVLTRASACPDIAPNVLLHAGPPYRGSAPAPVLQAAMQALLFEGAAADERGAARLLGEGSFHLEPAQDHGIVTPLAQVVSASMPLVKVELRGAAAFAALVEGPAPALRFGSLSPACRVALRDTGAWAEATLAPMLHRRAVDIGVLVSAATKLGDECHARTVAAHAALLGQLQLADDDAARLSTNPAFVLTVLMAASAAALRAGGGTITGIGGNGLDYGIRLRSTGQWEQRAAQPPQGPRLAGHESTGALAAIGDSAVIDFCGLGGQAFAAAPALVAEWHGVLPADAATRRDAIVDPATGLVDPLRVAATRRSPFINLGILDRSGSAGLIGRGVYCVPLDLLAAACPPGAQFPATPESPNDAAA
jgi:hypothetical protein